MNSLGRRWYAEDWGAASRLPLKPHGECYYVLEVFVGWNLARFITGIPNIRAYVFRSPVSYCSYAINKQIKYAPHSS